MKPGKPIPVTLAPRAIMFLGMGTASVKIMCPTGDIRLGLEDDQTAMKAEESLREYASLVDVGHSAEAIIVGVFLGKVN